MWKDLNLRKLSELEVWKQYQIEITNRFAAELKYFAVWMWLVGSAQVLHGVVDLTEKAKA
jgi:hypothetical protein